MLKLYVLSVFLHILAAVVWLGGALFLVMAVMPVLRKPELASLRVPVIRAVGRAFRPIGWTCLAILVVTGTVNLHFRGWLRFLDDLEFWASPMGRLLALKLAVVAFILVLSAAHDFWLGPRSVRLAEAARDTGAPNPLRQVSAWMGRITVALGLLAVLLGVMFVRGRPW